MEQISKRSWPESISRRSASNNSQHQHQGDASIGPSNIDTLVAELSGISNTTPSKQPQAIQQANPMKGSFLDLPGELRDMIYIHCLSSTSSIVDLSCDETWHIGRAIINPILSYETHPASPVNSSITTLLSTCKNIHDKVIPLLYDQTTFIVSTVTIYGGTHPSTYMGRPSLSPSCASHVRNMTLKRHLTTQFTDFQKVEAWMGSIPTTFSAAFPNLKTLTICLPAVRMDNPEPHARLPTILWVTEYIRLLEGRDANFGDRMGFLEEAVRTLRGGWGRFPGCLRLELRSPFGQGWDWDRNLGAEEGLGDVESPFEVLLQKEFGEALERVKMVDEEFGLGMGLNSEMEMDYGSAGWG